MLCKVSLHYQLLLGIGQASEAMEDPGTRHSETGGGPAGEVTHGLGGVAGGLLIPHADVLNTLLLHRHPHLTHTWDYCYCHLFLVNRALTLTLHLQSKKSPFIGFVFH